MLLKSRGHVSNCLTVGRRSISWDCRKEHQGNQNSGWSLLHVAADMAILTSVFCTTVHELKRNQSPSVAKNLGAVRSEEEQRGQRLICSVPGVNRQESDLHTNSYLLEGTLLLQRYTRLNHKRHSSMFFSVFSQTDFTKNVLLYSVLPWITA